MHHTAVALGVLLISMVTCCDAHGGRMPVLSVSREVMLAAGHGPAQVAIDPDLAEGGWMGPSDMLVDRSGALYLVDAGNNRILRIDARNRVTAVATWKSFSPTSITETGSGALLAAGVSNKGLYLERLQTKGGSPHTVARLPKCYGISAIAADGRGAYVLAIPFPDLAKNNFWYLPQGHRVWRQVELPARTRALQVVRGHDGIVYASVSGASGCLVVRLADGRTSQLEGRLAECQVLVGVDVRHRVYAAESIVGPSPYAPAASWGYILSCYRPQTGRLALVYQAETRYRAGDIAGYPDAVGLGEMPLTVTADGCLVLRTSDSHVLRLRYLRPQRE